jgi:hypothetical protein
MGKKLRRDNNLGRLILRPQLAIPGPVRTRVADAGDGRVSR